MNLYIIFTRSAVLLSRKSYVSWRQIQDELGDYKASLGPWAPQDVIEWLATEYSDLSPAAPDQVRTFLMGEEETAKVTFDPVSFES